ncbi:helix-turn-helix transcriptional regulator [Methylobacter sp. G7]|uniref:helix-turn-helix domain-containing protein n=1 Tax=Methylobacter sp. G7 TaxID=3230117 RepID=UPI003D8069DE
MPKIINSYLKVEKTPQDNQLNWNLTSREAQVLKLIAAGYKNKDIADSLCISLNGIGGSFKLRPCHTTWHAGPHQAVREVEVM